LLTTNFHSIKNQKEKKNKNKKTAAWNR